MPFEFDGEQYKKASDHQRQWGAQLISELRLTGREQILDLGCGDGAPTAQLAGLVPQGHVLGIDASEGMIASTRRHARANLTFRLQDINEIDFHDEFDVVFSNATLHWIKDHCRLLANVLTGLRTDGVARFSFAGDGNCSNLFRVLDEVMGRAEFASYFREFDWPWYMPMIDAYSRLASGFDFREVKVWGENADRHFPDVESMVRWIDQPSLVPLLKHVDGPDKRRFRDAVVQRMIAETRQNDGRCFETFRRVHLFARR